MTTERKKELDAWYDTKFWVVFSNKKAKKKGREALYKLDPSDEEMEQIFNNTLARNRYRKWTEQHGKFFAIDPYPERYFRDERWLDELPNCSTQETDVDKKLCECGNEAGPKYKGKHVCTECFVQKYDTFWKKDLYERAVTLDREISIKPDETKQDYNTRMRTLAFSKGINQIRKEGF